jgi:hypothetical protein
MTMYLVLSAFTSSPIFLAATTKAFAFSFTVCTLPPSKYYSYCLIILINKTCYKLEVKLPLRLSTTCEGV